MTAPVISISPDSSEESVGSHVLRLILFGTIPTSIIVIPVVPAEVPIVPADPLIAPEVGAVFVISPTGVLDLVDYSSSSDSDPSKDSLPVAPELPFVSPFLCSDDSEADSESEPAEQRPERHESLAPSSEFPLAPVVAPPEIHRRPAILRVGPFPARILAWRRVSHCSSDRHSLLDFTSDSSSSGSSLDSLSDISSGSFSYSLSDSSSVHSSGCDVSGMDKSKITRKQSKASKHGHENQKSSKRSQRYKAEAKSLAISSFMKPQGPVLQIPKVIYNLKKGKEREGLKESKCQTPTVLTVEIRAPKVLLFTRLPRFTNQGKSKGFSKLKGA
ncbi:hypothetical protein Tco_1516778 [Tanacetum coccineum]